jgi:hypothetical protein
VNGGEPKALLEGLVQASVSVRVCVSGEVETQTPSREPAVVGPGALSNHPLGGFCSFALMNGSPELDGIRPPSGDDGVVLPCADTDGTSAGMPFCTRPKGMKVLAPGFNLDAACGKSGSRSVRCSGKAVEATLISSANVCGCIEKALLSSSGLCLVAAKEAWPCARAIDDAAPDVCA